jgi:5-deoxy-glucuronate isomerase
VSRLIKASTSQGYQDAVPDGNPYTKFLRFGLIKLAAGESYQAVNTGVETLAVVLTGTVNATVDGESWEGLGGRESVFDGPASSVYIPLDSSFTFVAETDVEVALCSTVTDEKLLPFVISPEEVQVSDRGDRNWKRTIRDILTTSGEGRVSRLVVGETINSPGDWSSYPPHKHDGQYAPEEPNFEEIYHYRVDPPEGFGVQLHYTDDRSIDDAHTVRDGDTFVIEQGYHPLAAAGGHSLYYLWVMAGDTGRALNPYIEPAYRWLL